MTIFVCDEKDDLFAYESDISPRIGEELWVQREGFYQVTKVSHRIGLKIDGEMRHSAIDITVKKQK